MTWHSDFLFLSNDSEVKFEQKNYNIQLRELHYKNMSPVFEAIEKLQLHKDGGNN